MNIFAYMQLVHLEEVHNMSICASCCPILFQVLSYTL